PVRRRDQPEDALVLEELRALLREADGAAARAGAALASGTAAADAAAGGPRLALHVGQLLVGEPAGNRIPEGVDVAERLGQHELAAQLALEAREVLGRFDDGVDGFALDEPVGARRPGGGHAVDRERAARRRGLHEER